MQRASSLTCRLPSLQSDVLLLSCRAVEMRTGQGQGHCRRWGAALGGGGSACLQGQLLQKMHPHLQHLSCFVPTWSVLRWLCCLPCGSLEVLCPESCCRAVGTQSAFHTLAPFPADVSLDILHNTAVSPPLPLHPARQKPQREVKSRMTFSAKPLLKIPDKLIIFSPCSAILTFFSPKLHAYLWQN